MRITVCTGCGTHSQPQHHTNLSSGLPAGWLMRRQITSDGREVFLFACSDDCRDRADADMPPQPRWDQIVSE